MAEIRDREPDHYPLKETGSQMIAIENSKRFRGLLEK